MKRALTLCIVGFFVRPSGAETVMVEFRIADKEPSIHRLMYDTNQPTVSESHGPASDFWRWGSHVSHLTSPRSGEAQWTSEYNVNATRIWSLKKQGFSLLEFRADGGPEGITSTTPSVMLLFNGPLNGAPTAQKLKEGVVLSKCDGHRLLQPNYVCGEIEQAQPVSVNWMALDPVFSIFPDGDVDRDFEVGFQDLVILADNFGTSASTSSQTPEPSAGLLMMCATLYLVNWRRSPIG